MKTKERKQDKRSRAMRSAQERQELIEEFKASGLSQAAFCRRKKIHPGTFSAWLPRRKAARRRRQRPGAKGCDFEEVDVSVNGVAPIEIELPKGVVIRVGEASLLKHVVEFMREVGAC